MPIIVDAVYRWYQNKPANRSTFVCNLSFTKRHEPWDYRILSFWTTIPSPASASKALFFRGPSEMPALDQRRGKSLSDLLSLSCLTSLSKNLRTWNKLTRLCTLLPYWPTSKEQNLDEVILETRGVIDPLHSTWMISRIEIERRSSVIHFLLKSSSDFLQWLASIEVTSPNKKQQ